MEIVIKEVESSTDIKEFIAFPNWLYRGCPYYVPSLARSEMKILTKHPALEFCSLKMWLAYADGQIVGRIAGIINHKCNQIKR